MAKTSGRPTNIHSLLTAAEKKIVDGSMVAALAAASRQELESLRKQARTLRDKWRDLFNRQTIATKRQPARPSDPANTRSLEKSDVFADAIKRIEARLAELTQGVTKAVGGGTRSVKAGRTGAARSITKPARQATHRATRATIREELSHAMAAINETARKLVGKGSGKKPVKGKTASASPKAGAVTAPEKTVVKAGLRAKKASRKPMRSKKARQAGTLQALTATGTGQAVSFDVKKQRSAKARATVARLKVDGEATRRKGFVVSNTKRKQARRDSR